MNTRVKDLQRCLDLLDEILNHQIANRDYPESRFYSCYTYKHGEFPEWVEKAENILKEYQ